MKDRTRSLLLISAGIAGIIVIIGLLAVSSHLAGRDIHYLETSVKFGLTHFYKKNVLESQPLQNGGTNVIAVAALKNALMKELDGNPGYFPSFIKPKDVFIPVGDVSTHSTELICVIQMSPTLWLGIEANGSLLDLSQHDFEAWPHVALEDK